MAPKRKAMQEIEINDEIKEIITSARGRGIQAKKK